MHRRQLGVVEGERGGRLALDGEFESWFSIWIDTRCDLDGVFRAEHEDNSLFEGDTDCVKTMTYGLE